MKNPISSRAGFTLVELMVAVVVAGIFGIASVRLFMMQSQAYLRQNEGVLAGQNGRAGFHMLVREVRNAGYDPRGLALAGITKWRADSIAWTADLNADGDVLDTHEAVMYFHDDGAQTLVRREGVTDLIVADDISALQFDYFEDEGGTVATTADEIRQIRIGIEFDTPDDVMDGELETQLAIRNNIY